MNILTTTGTDVPPELQTIFTAALSREFNLIKKIIANGAESKALKLKDPQKIAELLRDCLEGLRVAVFSRKANFFPDKDQFYDLLKPEKDLVS